MKALDLINFSKLSKLLTGTKKTIIKNKITMKHQGVINDLESKVIDWSKCNQKLKNFPEFDVKNLKSGELQEAWKHCDIKKGNPFLEKYTEKLVKKYNIKDNTLLKLDLEELIIKVIESTLDNPNINLNGGDSINQNTLL